jgi:hypothetical protein
MTRDTILMDEQADVRTMLLAFLRDGEYAAYQTEQFLKLWTKSLGLKKLPPLPAEFLLELSAVIRIAAWQRGGLTVEMQADFPPAEELLRELLERLLHRPKSFAVDPAACPAPLHGRVTRLWLRHCSWSAPAEVGVDVVVRRPHPDLLRDIFTELLRSSRAS